MQQSISGKTNMFCLIGSPVGHSGSPAMYNYGFQKLGLDNIYLAYDVGTEETESAVQGLRTLGCKGFNVTMPCKSKVAQLVDELSDAARLIGACNTVVEQDGRLMGHNTDGVGFVRSLKENGVSIQGKRLTILGAGGAATAIQVQAALDGAAEIAIFNWQDEFFENAKRTAQKLKEIAPNCAIHVYPLDDEETMRAEIGRSDILVNATRIGMEPMADRSPVPHGDMLHPNLVVYDVVYLPRETQLLKDAKAAGCRLTLGGIGMLLWQGAEAFALFTGEEMPADEVYDKFFANM